MSAPDHRGGRDAPSQRDVVAQPGPPQTVAPVDRRRLVGEFLRFAIVGGANTAVSFAAYLLLLRWMRYEIAYACAYLLGIATAYVANALFVFRRPLRTRSALTFPLVYVAQFLISLGVLKLAVEGLALPQWLALGATIALTMPVTFVLARWVLRRG